MVLLEDLLLGLSTLQSNDEVNLYHVLIHGACSYDFRR